MVATFLKYIYSLPIPGFSVGGGGKCIFPKLVNINI